MCIGRRLDAVDPRSEFFPKLLDAFYDMSGYTVEAFVDGGWDYLANCADDQQLSVPDGFDAEVFRAELLERCPRLVDTVAANLLPFINECNGSVSRMSCVDVQVGGGLEPQKQDLQYSMNPRNCCRMLKTATAIGS